MPMGAVGLATRSNTPAIKKQCLPLPTESLWNSTGSRTEADMYSTSESWQSWEGEAAGVHGVLHQEGFPPFDKRE